MNKLIPTLLLASCTQHHTEEEVKVIETQVEVYRECAQNEFDVIIAIVFLALGTYLQVIGLWSRLASLGKWVLFDSVKAFKAWSNRMNGEE